MLPYSLPVRTWRPPMPWASVDRKSTRLNSSHTVISYAVFCLKKKNQSRQTALTPHDMQVPVCQLNKRYELLSHTHFAVGAVAHTDDGFVEAAGSTKRSTYNPS